MNRTKLISIIALGLLIANICLAAFIMLRKPPLPLHLRPRQIIIERLHFSEAQVDKYDRLIDWHRSTIRQKDEEMLQLKTQLYNCLLNKNQPLQDSLLAEIGKVQISIENVHLKHFDDIRQLCTQQQQEDFEALLKDIAGIFSRPKGEPGPK